MKIVVVGHRGSGKTSLVKRWKDYLHLPAFDLDQELASDTSKLFKQIGEEAFRKKEIEKFKEIYSKNKSFLISLGAGFQGEIPKDVKVYWLKRPSDKKGRIFLDRPRLNPDLSPLEEFFLRKNQRDKRFQEISHDIWHMPEGFSFSTQEEKNLLLGDVNLSNMSITLSPKVFKSEDHFQNYIESRLKWNLHFFEIRDDLLNPEEIKKALFHLPSDKVLLSFRSNKENPQFLNYIKEHPLTRWDWAHELGDCPFAKELDILSIHEKSLEEAIKICKQQQARVYKLAPKISTMEDLLYGHQWLKESADHSFLPRSDGGRWKWYRVFSSPHQAIIFLADIQESASDQPYPLDYLFSQPKKASHFAAVIGKPISHTYSPAQHFFFFKERSMAFYAIEAETEKDLKVLIQLGLKYAAVTSPLKKRILSLVDKKSERLKELKSVNSLFITKNKVIGHNTDYDGLKKILDEIEAPAVLWGGGGMLPLIKSLKPEVNAYSFRSGKPREGEKDFNEVNTIIWAVGREHYQQKEAKWPPNVWQPKKLIDLHYTFDSPGVEYAEKLSCNYISGLRLFEEQAKWQQVFWSENERK